MLLMKAATARVTNQGINKFGTLYTDTELAYYVNQKVNIKWDIDDVTKLYVYDMDGKKICEAVSAELLAFRPALFSGGTGEASARSETKRARGQGVSGGASPPLRAAA